MYLLGVTSGQLTSACCRQTQKISDGARSARASLIAFAAEAQVVMRSTPTSETADATEKSNYRR
jgi:hypothetical protein